MIDRLLDRLAERGAIGAAIAGVYRRYGEVHGNQLAAALTLIAFLSLFPLLLALIGVVGFFARNAGDLPGEIIQRLGIPADGDAARTLTRSIAKAEESRRAASIIGFVGVMWSGLGVVSALESAFDAVWQVSGRGLKDKAYGVAWLAGAVVLFAASLAVTAALRILPWVAAPLVVVLSLGVGVALWLWTFNILTNRDVGWRAMLPGAVLGAVGLEALKLVGALWVPRLVASSSALYGSIGIVFAVLAWLLVFGRLVVYAAVLNVVRWEAHHGTVTAEVEIPRMPGAVPVVATRAGEEQPLTAASGT